MTTIAIAPETSQRSYLSWWLIAAMAWVVLFALALKFDAAAASWAHRSGIDTTLRSHRLTEIWKFPGNYVFTLLVIAVGLAWHRLSWREGLFIAIAGAMSGFNVIIKWTVGRTRPFKLGVPDEPLPFRLHPLWHGWWGLFHQKALSFPSGHESVVFALAVAIALIRPRVAPVFFFLAIAVGVERVLENAHYLSDVVAAMPLAAAGAFIAWAVIAPPASLEETR